MDGRIHAYQANDTLGRSQIDLILKVYDGAIKAFRDADSHYDAGNNDAGFEQMERAKRFITHLYTTLDFEQGGEVALSLAKVYVHIINESNVIQATKSREKIEVIIGILDQVRSGWQRLKEQGVEAQPVADAVPASVPEGGFVISG